MLFDVIQRGWWRVTVNSNARQERDPHAHDLLSEIKSIGRCVYYWEVVKISILKHKQVDPHIRSVLILTVIVMKVMKST